MGKLWILIAGLTVAVIGLVAYCRRTVTVKNRSIVRQIREQERLERLLENAIRKNIMLNNRLKSAQADARISNPREQETGADGRTVCKSSWAGGQGKIRASGT